MVKNLPAKAGRLKGHGFNPWVRKIPWRRKWQPIPVFLSGKSHGQRSLAGYIHGVTKSWTRLNNYTFFLLGKVPRATPSLLNLFFFLN